VGSSRSPDQSKIFNDALLKAVGHKDAPSEVKAALRTEDGDDLEIVNEPLPEQHDPHRQGERASAGHRSACPGSSLGDQGGGEGRGLGVVRDDDPDLPSGSVLTGNPRISACPYERILASRLNKTGELPATTGNGNRVTDETVGGRHLQTVRRIAW
jgi:hypothetical protein